MNNQNSPILSDGKNTNYPAKIVSASIIIGAVIISGTLIYNFKVLLKHLDSQSAVQNVQVQAGTVPSAAAPSAPSQAAAPTTGAVKITLAPNTPYLGASNAKVTVVEYADYECPFCQQFFKNVFSVLKTKYIDTGKIKFVYQDFAFLGPDSNTAAEASHCAEDQNKFWQYHDYLFNNQGQEGSGWATADHQKQFAAAVGLNTATFNQCLDSGKYKQEVLNETAAGKSYGVSGTPTAFVNGQIIVGAQPVASFEQAIDAALKK
jgi:protein-disulfide isomerase